MLSSKCQLLALCSDHLHLLAADGRCRRNQWSDAATSQTGFKHESKFGSDLELEAKPEVDSAAVLDASAPSTLCSDCY